MPRLLQKVGSHHWSLFITETDIMAAKDESHPKACWICPRNHLTQDNLWICFFSLLPPQSLSHASSKQQPSQSIYSSSAPLRCSDGNVRLWQADTLSFLSDSVESVAEISHPFHLWDCCVSGSVTAAHLQHGQFQYRHILWGQCWRQRTMASSKSTIYFFRGS